MKDLLRRFVREEEAPTIVEYAIMLVLVAIAVASAAPGFRQAVVNVFTTTVGWLSTAS